MSDRPLTAVHVLASGANRSGGAEVYTSELLKRLPSRGLDITLFCLQNQVDQELQRVCRVVKISPGKSNDLPVVWRFSPALQLASLGRAMRTHVRPAPRVVIGMGPQLIWAHRRVYGPLPLVYLPHSMIAPVEVSSYRWGSRTKRAVAAWLLERLELESLNQAFRTVRFTQAGCEALRAYYRGRARPVFEVIPPAVDLQDLGLPGPASGPVRLLSVARLTRTKNVSFLIQALATLPAADWTLDVLGDGEERHALESMTRDVKLDGRITFHGHVDPKPFYARAHLHVMPSLMENAPLVILEAMAHGVPTLALRADGVRYLNANHELITHTRDGLLAADERDFEIQLERLVGSRELLASMGLNARATIEQRHTWTAHLDAWEKLLRAAE
jgi:glycosyltransferase involved in cell wall biosynthesis